jgi:hypothetical protein
MTASSTITPERPEDRPLGAPRVFTDGGRRDIDPFNDVGLRPLPRFLVVADADGGVQHLRLPAGEQRLRSPRGGVVLADFDQFDAGADEAVPPAEELVAIGSTDHEAAD